jgi:hypothetical protein
MLNLLNGNGAVGILLKASEDAKTLGARKETPLAQRETIHTPPEATGPKSVRIEDLKAMQASLEASEYLNDAFHEGNVMRSNFMGLVTEIVTALVVILAIKHTDKVTSPIFSSTYVTIILLVFLAMAISRGYYFFDHWQTLLELARRTRSKNFEEESKPAELGTAMQMERDAVDTAWQVRMASGEIFISALKVPVGLVNKFLTYILVAVILSCINTAFSDGQFVVPKVTVLLEIVIIIFVDYTTSSYRREVVARQIRLRGRG